MGLKLVPELWLFIEQFINSCYPYQQDTLGKPCFSHPVSLQPPSKVLKKSITLFKFHPTLSQLAVDWIMLFMYSEAQQIQIQTVTETRHRCQNST